MKNLNLTHQHDITPATPFAHQLKNKEAVIIEYPENSAVSWVQAATPFHLPASETQAESYLRDARRILDRERASLNTIGLERLIAAIIIEFRGNDYRGKDN